MTETTTDDSWFYTQGGQRLGPVSADKLRELLAAQLIDGETPIWRKGLGDWQPVRATEIGASLQDSPPPVAAAHVNNMLVWTLAFMPIAYVVIDAFIYGYRVNHPEADQTFLNSRTWMIPFAINGGLCFGEPSRYSPCFWRRSISSSEPNGSSRPPFTAMSGSAPSSWPPSSQRSETPRCPTTS